MNPPKPAVVAPIRDAVVAALNAESFVTGFNPAISAQGLYDISHSLSELKTPRIIVVPATKETGVLTRNSAQSNEVSLDLAVQYKFTAPTPTELDPYMKLAEQIESFLLGQTVSATAGTPAKTYDAFCQETSFEQLFVDEHIRQFRVFTSVVRAVFLVNL